jgi:hypothetical protein
MKRHIWLLGAVVVLGVGGAAYLAARNAADPPLKEEKGVKGATSKIVQVTVYPDSALVTREVDVPAGDGIVEVVVTPLPPHTINSSLYSEGSDGIRVLTTRFRNRPVEEDAREEVRKLDDEIKKLSNDLTRVQSEIAACQANQTFLGKLENFTTASTTHATEKGKLDSDATIQMAKYLMDGRNEKTKEMVALNVQVQTIQEKLEFAQRQRRDMTVGSSRVERDAVIVVDKAAGPGKIRLNYMVDAASWRPEYKFRAGAKNTDPVQVEYMAAITQQSGEDWTGVTLIFSTAQPMLNATPPELRTLAVGVMGRGNEGTINTVLAQPVPNPPGQGGPGQPGQGRQGGARGGDFKQAITGLNNPVQAKEFDNLKKQAEELRQEAQKEFNNKDVMRGNDIQNYAAALDQARDLVVLEGDRGFKGLAPGKMPRNEGPTVTYKLKSRFSVPSRNDEQVIEMARLTLKPDYFYKAVPVLTPCVYRQANLTNDTTYVLLPGEATMYHETDFVGRMRLPLVAIGEQFTIGFGAEPQLQVQRVMMDKSRTMKGGNQILQYEYRILLSSYKPEKVKLQLWDRLPHAENETIGVTLVKATPDVSKDPLYQREERPNNLLRWDLEVDPTMNGEKALSVNYEFKLELDKQMTIGSVQSK